MQVQYEGMKKALGFDDILWLEKKHIDKINHTKGQPTINEKTDLLHTQYERLTQGW